MGTMTLTTRHNVTIAAIELFEAMNPQLTIEPESSGSMGQGYAEREIAPPTEKSHDAIRPEVSEAAVAELDYIADVGERFGPPPPMPPPGAVEIINLLRRTYEEISFDRDRATNGAAVQFFAAAEASSATSGRVIHVRSQKYVSM